ncbi:uncharacterized protein LOC128646832 [Bombina bombina]|uniref:uncharacterized protein LOC128646832 n=1 Tax=Bombina bombina TaxID=8345 RepID=UPI00235B0CED|nr:uncharacterized protein LOC128646832 [Bombina bombina]
MASPDTTERSSEATCDSYVEISDMGEEDYDGSQQMKEKHNDQDPVLMKKLVQAQKPSELIISLETSEGRSEVTSDSFVEVSDTYEEDTECSPSIMRLQGHDCQRTICAERPYHHKDAHPECHRQTSANGLAPETAKGSEAASDSLMEIFDLGKVEEEQSQRSMTIQQPSEHQKTTWVEGCYQPQTKPMGDEEYTQAQVKACWEEHEQCLETTSEGWYQTKPQGDEEHTQAQVKACWEEHEQCLETTSEGWYQTKHQGDEEHTQAQVKACWAEHGQCLKTTSEGKSVFTCKGVEEYYDATSQVAEGHNSPMQEVSKIQPYEIIHERGQEMCHSEYKPETMYHEAKEFPRNPRQEVTQVVIHHIQQERAQDSTLKGVGHEKPDNSTNLLHKVKHTCVVLGHKTVHTPELFEAMHEHVQHQEITHKELQEALHMQVWLQEAMHKEIQLQDATRKQVELQVVNYEQKTCQGTTYQSLNLQEDAYEEKKFQEGNCKHNKIQDTYEQVQLCERTHEQVQLCERTHEQVQLCERTHEQVQLCERTHEQVQLCERTHEQVQLCERTHEQVQLCERTHEQVQLCEGTHEQVQLCEGTHEQVQLCEGTHEQVQLCEGTHEQVQLCKGTHEQVQLCEGTHEQVQLCEGTHEQVQLCEGTHEQVQLCEGTHEQVQLCEGTHEQVQLCEGTHEQVQLCEGTHEQVQLCEGTHEQVQLCEGTHEHDFISEQVMFQEGTHEQKMHQDDTCEMEQESSQYTSWDLEQGFELYGPKTVHKQEKLQQATHEDVEHLEATFKEVELLEATFKEVELLEATFKEVELLEATHKEVELLEATHKEVELLEATRKEVELLEATRKEVELLEATRKEVELLEATRKEVELLEATRKEVELLEATRKEVELLEATRKEVELLEATRKEVELLEATRKEVELLEATRKEVELLEATRKEVELLEATRKEVELLEATRKEVELLEATRKEVELQQATRNEVELLEATREEVELQQATHKEVELQQATREEVELQQNTHEWEKSQTATCERQLEMHQDSMYEKIKVFPGCLLSDGGSYLAPAEHFWAVNMDQAVRLRMDHSVPGSAAPLTVPQLLTDSLRRFGSEVALCMRRAQQWYKTTYQEYGHQCRAVAKGLLKLGLKRFRGVVILGYNSPEWFVAEIGSILAGGVAIGIDPSCAPSYFLDVALRCDAQVLIVQGQAQLMDVLEVLKTLPQLTAIVQWGEEIKVRHPMVYTWAELLSFGSEMTDSQLNDVGAAQKANQCCAVMYVAGRGVMLSHDNLTWTSRACCEMLDLGTNDRVVSYLPLCHVASQLSDLWMPLCCGTTTYFAEPDCLKGSLFSTLRYVQPTRFLGFPLLWEKIQRIWMSLEMKASPIHRKIIRCGRGIGLQAYCIERSVPWGYTLAKHFIFHPARKALGLDQCRYCYMGLVSPDVNRVKYYGSLALPLLGSYGLEESSGFHSLALPEMWRRGSCGQKLPGCRTRIKAINTETVGEICLWGRHIFMGYLGMEKETRKVLDKDGWLHSGDLGIQDSDGFIYVTQRSKGPCVTPLPACDTPQRSAEPVYMELGP